MLEVVRQLQLLVLAMILLGAAAAKLSRVLRAGSLAAGLGPTALFPAQLRRPAAIIVCAAEIALGAGLLVTASSRDPAVRADATGIRLTTAVLFLVAMCALVELRARRPDAGCGCFGSLSTKPVGARSIVRAGLLAVAALATVGVGPVRLPAPGPPALRDLGLLVAEFLVIAVLSPEVGEALVRLGYTEPCELRRVQPERALAALRRSSAWRRHAREIGSEQPADMWRELCWWYVVYPARRDGSTGELVFAIQVKKHRPSVQVATVSREPTAEGTSTEPSTASPAERVPAGTAGRAAARPGSSAPATGSGALATGSDAPVPGAGRGVPVPARRDLTEDVPDDSGPISSAIF